MKLTGQKKSTKKVIQRLIHYAFRTFIFLLSGFGLMSFRFIGIDKLKQDKGCLFIANHPTLIDYVAIVSKLPTCDNIVKNSLWQNKYVRNVISSAGYIPNIDPEQTFDAIKSTLQKGNNLLMFPEGTRTVPGQPISLKRGAAQIAIRANAPIRIIHLSCQPNTLAKNEKWYKIAPVKPRFTLKVGQLIDPNTILQETGLPSIAARKLTRVLQKQLEKKVIQNDANT